MKNRLVIAAALALAGLGTDAVLGESRPNILIILADDMGWNDVSMHGGSIPTPNIDRLAAEGLELQRFYTNPKCSPSRAALLTGRDPLKLGLTYATVYPWNPFGVALSEHFIGESFRDQGYETAMVGKWHLGHHIPAHHPNNRGFDWFFGSLNTGGDYFTHANQGGFDLQRNGASVPDLVGQYNTDLYTAETVHWLREVRDKSKPFLLYVAYKAPHSPFQAPPELVEEFGHVYPAMMVSMDRGIGRILDALDQEDVADDTIVLFFSDNGATQGGGSNEPLRGYKLSTYEGGIRVVAVMRWPAVLDAGTVSEQVITSLDLFPTLASAAGVDVLAERELDGEDLWAALESGRVVDHGDIFYAAENFLGREFSFSVLRGSMKLVQHVKQTFEDVDVVNELYDVREDPNESRDLADQRPELVSELAAALADWRRQHPYAGSHTQLVPHPGWRAPLDWAEMMRLNGLNIDERHDDNLYGAGTPATRGLIDDAYGDRGRLVYPTPQRDRQP